MARGGKSPVTARKSKHHSEEQETARDKKIDERELKRFLFFFSHNDLLTVYYISHIFTRFVLSGQSSMKRFIQSPNNPSDTNKLVNGPTLGVTEKAGQLSFH